MLYLINALHLLAPPLGELDAKRTEGVSYRPKELGWAVIGTSYHSTHDTPSDLASLGHLPQRGRQGVRRYPVKFQFIFLLTKADMQIT